MKHLERNSVFEIAENISPNNRMQAGNANFLGHYRGRSQFMIKSPNIAFETDAVRPHIVSCCLRAPRV
jgi:hypothetical protein